MLQKMPRPTREAAFPRIQGVETAQQSRRAGIQVKPATAPAHTRYAAQFVGTTFRAHFNVTMLCFTGLWRAVVAQCKEYGRTGFGAKGCTKQGGPNVKSRVVKIRGRCVLWHIMHVRCS